MAAMRETNGSSSFLMQNLLAKKHILIVDDDDDYAEALAEIFTMQSSHVMYKKDPVCAMEYALHHDLDLVIIDKNMPRLDGLEFAERVRQVKPSLNIILMTAYPNHESRKRSLEIGIRYYLIKPFRKNDILEIASFLFL